MSRYNRKVNAVLEAARVSRAARLVLAAVAGPAVDADPFRLEECDDFADAIAQLVPYRGADLPFDTLADEMADIAFKSRDISSSGYAAGMLAYLDGGYPAFDGSTAAPAGQFDALRTKLANDSDYDATVTGLGAEGDPIAKLIEYVVANATFVQA